MLMMLHSHTTSHTKGTSTPNGGPKSCPAKEECPAGVVTMPDGLHGGLVDVTQKAARDYVWSMIEDGYGKHGIQVFWLDGSEPEYYNFPQWGQVHWQNATWEAGQCVLLHDARTQIRTQTRTRAHTQN